MYGERSYRRTTARRNTPSCWCVVVGSLRAFDLIEVVEFVACAWCAVQLSNLQRPVNDVPFYLADPFRSNCNRYDFLEFVVECLQQGQLVAGAYLRASDQRAGE